MQTCLSQAAAGRVRDGGVKGVTLKNRRRRRRRRRNRRTKTGLLSLVLSEGDQAGALLTHTPALLPGGWQP